MKRTHEDDVADNPVTKKLTSASSRSRQPLDAAIRAVAYASKITTFVQATQEGSIEKGDSSPVTVADYAAQCLITAYLHTTRAFEGSFRLVAEEEPGLLQQTERQKELDQVTKLLNEHFPFSEMSSDKDTFSSADVLALLRLGSDSGGPNGSFWVLDPVDGTTGFIRNAQYAIGLGLVADGVPILGVMGCPNLACLGGDVESKSSDFGHIFFASDGRSSMLSFEKAYKHLADEGKGSRNEIAWHDIAETLTPVSKAASESTFCESYEMQLKKGASISPELKVLNGLRRLKLDSMAKYALVARGDAQIYVRGNLPSSRHENIWDHCAGVPILQGAGGIVTDLRGKPLDFSLGHKLSANEGILATSNAQLHKDILSEIRILRPESTL